MINLITGTNETISVNKLFTISTIKEFNTGNSSVCVLMVNINMGSCPILIKGMLSLVGYENSKVFIGKTNCHKEDSYDELIGKDLAEHRARVKALKYIQNTIKKLKEMHNLTYLQLDNMEVKTYNKQTKQLECINNIIHKNA